MLQDDNFARLNMARSDKETLLSATSMLVTDVGDEFDVLAISLRSW